MLVTVRGLVVGEVIASDNAKYIHVLTAERGKLSALVRGAVRLRGRFTSSTQVFCYSEFVLYERNGKYTLDDASLIENYFSICRDYDTLTLASYIISAADYLSVDEQPDAELLRLTLNTLWALSHREKLDRRLVKGAFEMRAAGLSGLAPDLTACRGCGKRELERAYLSVMDGCIYCPDCMAERELCSHAENDIRVDELRTAQILLPLEPPVLMAMRYSLYSEMGKLYSFSLDGKLVPEFAAACEKYFENQLDHHFPVLDMLNLAPPEKD